MSSFQQYDKKYIYNPVSWLPTLSSRLYIQIYSSVAQYVALLTQLYNSHSVSFVPFLDIYIKLLPEGKGKSRRGLNQIEV